MKKQKISKLQNDGKWAVVLLAPNIVGFLLFMLIPVIMTFVFSFTRYDIITAPEFIGLGNYIEMVNDPIIHQVTKNTVLYSLMVVPIGMCLSLLLAVLLDQKIKLKRFFRAAYFIPAITSMVVVAIVWQWIYNPEFGILNWVLSFLGLEGRKWLLDPVTALPALAIVGIWKNAGYNMIIFLSGLQGISNSYYEASMLDGASKWQQFKSITVPLLMPTTFFVFVTSVISSFQVFDQVMLMTNGGPGRATSVLAHYLYQNAFKYFKMGYACAIAVLLFAIIMILTVINMHMEKKMRDIF